MVDIVSICKKVLKRLNKMNYERSGGNFSEKLIFPKKIQSKGDVDRISEQELRQLFIEEFKIRHKDLFYAIEVPTTKKYRFKEIDESNNSKTQSALHDMCVFKKKGSSYERKLNIEFKQGNGAYKNTLKDIEKLVKEKENGVFIHLLKNTRRNTLCNKDKTGVFDKLCKSFECYSKKLNKQDKSIQIVIVSLKQKTLIYQTIKKGVDLKSVFSFKEKNGNITEVGGNGWERIELK